MGSTAAASPRSSIARRRVHPAVLRDKLGDDPEHPVTSATVPGGYRALVDA